jgi:hypothetical protein
VQLKNDEQRVQNYPLQKWISALLLSSVESLVERKLVVEREGTKDDGHEALLVRISTNLNVNFAYLPSSGCLQVTSPSPVP